MEEQYEVESVAGHLPKNATRYRTKKYIIKWKHYDDDENTEEEKKVMENQIPELVDAYWIGVSRAKKNKKALVTQAVEDIDMQVKLIQAGRTLTSAELGIKEEAVSDGEDQPQIAAMAQDSEVARKGQKTSKQKPKHEVTVKAECQVEETVQEPSPPPPVEPAKNKKKGKAKPKKEKVKQETLEEPEPEEEAASSRGGRRRGVNVNYAENPEQEEEEDELSGMEDEDADEDFDPIAKGHKRGRPSRADSESDEDEVEGEPEEEESEPEAQDGSDKENDGPTTSKQAKKTAKPKPAAGGPSGVADVSGSNNRAPTMTNRNRFQKHCKSCGKTLTASEVANPHSTDLAPFQARLDYLVKERKKYAKMLEELEAANLSDDDEEDAEPSEPSQEHDNNSSDTGMDTGKPTENNCEPTTAATSEPAAAQVVEATG